MRFLRHALSSFLALGAGALLSGAAHAAPAQAAADAALHSFADLYRLTVPGAALHPFPGASAGGVEAPAFQMRFAAGGAPAAGAAQAAPSAYRFSIARAPERGRWLLLLSGLALAAWVARRRLGYSIRN